MNNLRFAVFCFFLFSFFSVLHSQDYTLRVWPDSIPGSIENAGYESGSFYGRDSTSRLVRVTDPTLKVYLSPGDNASGAAVVICPGGGYRLLAVEHEGHAVAGWLNDLGIAGIVLNYRLPSDEIMEDKSIGPLQDVQEAIRIVRRHSGEWNLDPSRIGIMGFSAGGHLASTVSTLYSDKVYEADTTSARPDFSILVYPVISMDTMFSHRGSRNNLLGKDPGPDKILKFSSELQIDADTPPAFLVHSLDDKSVDPENSIRYAKALTRYQVPAELHLYEGGGHGYGLGRSEGTESAWPDACIKWLKMNGFLE